MRLFIRVIIQRTLLGLLLCATSGNLSAQQASGSKPFMAPSPYGGRQESPRNQPASQAQVYLEQQYSQKQQNPVQLGAPLHQTNPVQTAGWKQDITQSLPPLYSQNRAQTRRGQSSHLRQVGAMQTDYPSAFEAFSDDLNYPELERMPDPEGNYTESIDELCGESCWGWTVLPTDLLYTSYLAGPKEPRMALAVLNEKDIGWQMELEAGARVGLLRYGSMNDEVLEGWQLDVEGAGPPRLNIEEELDLDAADFRVGVPLTWRQGAYQAKFAYYHTSAHVGDEYLKRHPGFQRINYVRDVFVLGGGYFVDPDLRLYAEIGYAFNTDGGAEPWELQFGAEFSPAEHNGIYGAPFWAINGYLREEVDWGGNVNFMIGWQWRGDRNNHLFRIGFQYLDGKTMQYSFFQNSERMVGFGTWYDF
ncbi:hypothetical protein Pan241w_54760 [Gimesia alba]|uniref:DUF1207 domain-containing protein n=2 Tax=Gimesia alba TaxID=2527973 RepID=A0A517RN96_9PLAN|nr:hypothetical protein Pan241w_54760 [Gimesia alba]